MEKIRGHISSFISHPLHTAFYIFVVAISVYLLTTPNYLYAVLPGICIFLLLALSRNHKIGYYIIFFLIPCDSFRELTESLGFLSVSKFLGLLLALIVVLDILIHKDKLPSLKSNLWTWFLVFFAINFVSALTSEYKFTSFENLRQLLTAYVFFGLTMILVSQRGFAVILPVIIVSSITFISFLSILGFLLNWEMFAMNVSSGINIKRATGASGDPNVFSAMIIFNIPFLFYYFSSSRTFFRKTFFVCLFALSVSAIVCTFSRGGSLILGVVLFLLLIGYVRRLKPIHIGLALGSFAIAIAVMIILIPDSYWERMKRISLSSESIRARLTYLRIGFEMLFEYPVLGAGPGTFQEVYGRSIIARVFSYTGRSDFRHAHNSYLEVFSGTGFIGFVILAVILWITLENFHTAKRHFRLLQKNDMVFLTGTYRMSLISLMIYFFILSAFYHKFFWASLAFSQIALKLSRETDSKKTDENLYPDK